MANNIIDTADPGIVVKETPIKISDEKFKGALSRTYEQAQKDMNAFKIEKLFSIFLSIAGTLFLTLLTSDFRAIGTIEAECVKRIAWGICVVSAVAGFILMALRVSVKTKNDTAERDAAVEKIFTQYIC